ncbi:HypC/HybG/HupF family hydrogenase formation chaperone [Thermococcus sp.]|uniref:HypC/HybG/HupF family hydrogenase formation chaperone n=1 Tax=Thermococcus sp. TaxID=35749 RepID=UPI0026094B7A|nr:HypC/HybG/HupF family hydrogenase formation chaperone [Thermococcus sp.]
MALMLAGKVVEVSGDRAVVDVEGQLKEAKLDFVRDVKPGDYVTIYYGIVLEKVGEEEARETLEHCSYHRGEKVEMAFSLVENLRF